MQRAIAGYHQDSAGEWVAELACGHGQHVRHRPPFQLREWVLDRGGRVARLGTPLECPLCDQAGLSDERVDIDEEGGETACYAHLTCPDCGAVLDGGPHLGGCRSGG